MARAGFPTKIGGRILISHAESPRPDSERKRIMVLMSDTGGGHRASAEALKAGFETLYGDKYKVGVPFQCWVASDLTEALGRASSAGQTEVGEGKWHEFVAGACSANPL